MTINYRGQMKGAKHNTRYAEISYRDSEEKLVERITNLMLKVTDYDYDGYNNMITVSVENKEDFEEFAKWFREAKKTLKRCEKYGI